MNSYDDAKGIMADEIEKMENDSSKVASESFTPAEEKRLVRKLDFWYAALQTSLTEVSRCS